MSTRDETVTRCAAYTFCASVALSSLAHLRARINCEPPCPPPIVFWSQQRFRSVVIDNLSLSGCPRIGGYQPSLIVSVATQSARLRPDQGPWMHPFSSLTIGIFVAGYITARWDLVTRLYELAVFAWDHGVILRATKAFAIISLIYVLLAIPLDRIAAHEASLHPRLLAHGISAHEQLRRRGSF